MKLISFYRTKGLFWFRLLGYGFHSKNSQLHPLLFSERHGYTSKLRIGKYRIGLLGRR